MTTPVRPGLDPAALTTRLADADPPRLLDVRSPAEFAASHIPGSVNLPLDTVLERRAELRRHLDAGGTTVVLVCRSGQRAARAERALGPAGVAVLTGGLAGWEAAEGPLVRGPVRRGPGGWELERQVRFVAGSLVLVGLVGSPWVPGLQWFSGAIGAGLVVSAATGTCAMGSLLARAPWNRGGAPSPDEAIAQLSRGR